jgi:hypothetical protein
MIMSKVQEEIIVGAKRATKRDKWNAFHRLFRLATKQSYYHEFGAVESFWILFPYCWVALLENDTKTIGRSHMPKFIRRQLVERDRVERLYERDHKTRQQCQRAARLLAGQGIECTPDEVAEVRYKVLKMIRERSEGPLPESNRQLWEEVRRAYR